MLIYIHPVYRLLCSHLYESISMMHIAAPPPSLADKAYQSLRRMITQGAIGNEPVSEIRLAEEIGVSRTPIREAVRRLVGQGILEVTAQGVRLLVPSVEDLAEVYYTRAILEGAAGRLAANADGSAALIERLRAILEQAEPQLEADNHDAFVRLNGQFHGEIVAASGNRRIQEMLASLDMTIVRYRRMSLLHPEHLRRSYEDHLRILDLLDKKQPEQLEVHIRDHILRAGARIVSATIRIDGGTVAAGSTAATLLKMGETRSNEKSRDYYAVDAGSPN